MSKENLLVGCIGLGFVSFVLLVASSFLINDRYRRQERFDSLISASEIKTNDLSSSIADLEHALTTAEQRCAVQEMELSALRIESSRHENARQIGYRDSRSFEDVLRNSSDESLEQWVSDYPPNARIHAAWQLTQRDTSDRTIEWDARRFVGLIEGHLHINVPPVWQKAVYQCEHRNGRLETHLGQLREKATGLSWNEELRVIHPSDIEIWSDDDAVKIAKDGVEFSVAQSEFEDFPSGGGIGCCFVANRCYWGTYNTPPYLPVRISLTATEISEGNAVEKWQRHLPPWGAGGTVLVPAEGEHTENWSNYLCIVANEVYVACFIVTEHTIDLYVCRASDGELIVSFMLGHAR